MADQIIESNAHALDAHLTGHLLEFLVLVRRAYSKAIQATPGAPGLLGEFAARISDVMMEHDEHGCQEVRPPPEVRRLRFNNVA